MIINQYYSAGLSRATNYYHGYPTTYIPPFAPQTTFTDPTPKPTYYYCPPAAIPPYYAYGGQNSPVIIINNNTSCANHGSTAPLAIPGAPPTAPSPMPAYDPPSYTTTRRVAGGLEVPGMSPIPFGYSIHPSPARLPTPVLPALSPPSPPPSPPPPPPPLSSAFEHSSSRAKPRRHPGLQGHVNPSARSSLRIGSTRSLSRSTGMAQTRRDSSASRSGGRYTATSHLPRSRPGTTASQAAPMVSSARTEASTSTDSNPEVEQWRQETRRNTLLNSAQTNHQPLPTDGPGSPSQSATEQHSEREPVDQTPQAAVAAQEQPTVAAQEQPTVAVQQQPSSGAANRVKIAPPA